MDKSQKLIFIFSLFLLGISCNGSKEKPVDQPAIVELASEVKVVSLPDIPIMVTDPEQRVEYLVQHYWDNTSFADTAILDYKDQLEQGWADYLDLMCRVRLSSGVESVTALMQRLGQAPAVYRYFVELADKYLYDPNSPFRSEEIYIPVLESMIASPLLSELEKIRPEERLRLAKKNRPGTKALNFTYTLASGVQGTLHGIKADYTLLFVNNPGCHACAEYINGLKQSQIINELLDTGKLKILSFYTDTELDEWKNHLGDFPDIWINGYDKSQAVSTGNIYDLKAIPTLYLLDKNKTVILKDAPLQTVEMWLFQKVGNNG